MRKLLAAAAIAGALATGAALAQDAGMRHDPMARADADNDGKITRAEFLAQADTRFDRADADHDGIISADEMQAIGDRRTARRSGTSTAQDAPSGVVKPHRGGMRMLQRADANGDGKITRDEMRAAAGMQFDRMDANHDGVIDQAERDAMRSMMMRRMGSRDTGQ